MGKYLHCLLGFGLLGVFFYLSLFFFQVGAPLPAAYWLRDVEVVKEHVGAKAASPKLVFAGGSNVMFGIDCELIGNKIGWPVINLGLHGGFPLPYQEDFIAPFLDEGDVVVLLLEYPFYSRTDFFNGWYLNQLLTWDQDYFWSLSFRNKCKVLLGTTMKRSMDGVLAQFLSKEIYASTHRLPIANRSTIIRDAERRWSSDSSLDSSPGTYQVANFDRFGDVMNCNASKFERPPNYHLLKPLSFSTPIWGELTDMKQRFEKEGVSLFIGWPPMMDEAFQVTDALVIMENLNLLDNRFKELGFVVVGKSGDYVFKREHFFDTEYHLNSAGREIRSLQLTQDLADILDN